MTIKRVLWILVGYNAALIGGSFLAEEIGRSIPSVWTSAIVGLLIAVVVFVIARSLKGLRNLLQRDQNQGVALTLILSVLFCVGPAYVIFSSDSESLGQINYVRPYLGGLLIGLIAIGLFRKMHERRG